MALRCDARVLRFKVTAYAERVQRLLRPQFRLAGLPHDLQLLVDAMRLARNAPLAGRQPPTVRRFQRSTA